MTIQCDASQSGLGACILQQGKPIAYASGALSKAELNYAQIEKEMLSNVFAIRKFHRYIFGKEHVVIENDRKPLETTMKKTMDKIPPIFHRMMLNLQPHDLHVHYVPGKFMKLADTLSRAYLLIQNADHEDQEFDYAVRLIIKILPITSSKLEEFREATARDSTLKTVAKYCKDGWPRAQRNVPANVKKYWLIQLMHYACAMSVLCLQCMFNTTG